MEENSELNKNLKFLAKSSVLLMFGVVISKLLTYLFRIIIARYWGVEIYGLFSISLMIVGWFVLFSTVGLTQGLTRYISLFRGKKEFQKIRYLIKAVLSTLLVSGILSGLLLFFLSETIAIKIFHNENLIFFLKMFSIVIPLTTLTNAFLSIILSYEKVGWYSFIFNIFQNVAKILILIVLIFMSFQPNAIVFSYILGMFLTMIFSFIICKKILNKMFGVSKLKNSLKKKTFREIFSYSWPLMFFGVVSSIFYWTDTFFIGFFRDVKDVGLYNAAVPIALLLTLSSEFFIQILFPIINKEYAKNNNEIVKELSKQIAKWIFFINVPIFIVLIIFPGVALNILFGAEYISAENVVRILCFGFLFTSIFQISDRLLCSIGKSKVVLIDILIVSVINAVLNIILIPKYGITGAAFATSISLIILNLIYLFQSQYYIKFIPLRRKMIVMLIAGIISSFAVLIIKQYLKEINIASLIIVGLFFFMIYTSLVLLFKGLDKNDFMIIEAIKKKFV
jgi:O-antigen/teichoic acid export membrane protein